MFIDLVRDAARDFKVGKSASLIAIIFIALLGAIYTFPNQENTIIVMAYMILCSVLFLIFISVFYKFDKMRAVING